MAKVKLGNVKGPKGEQGVRGSKWYNTDKITGESTSGTAFPNSGIADAMVGDMALNPTTLNLYTCQTAGNAATAKWVFMACIKGPQGEQGPKGDPTTVDAVLSKDSTNPIQNKAVATKIQDVEDSLDRFILKKTMTVTTTPNGNASVELSSDDYTLIAVKCATGSGNYGVICTPYIFSLGSRKLGFHAMSEVAPFPAIANKELTVDVYYMRR